MWCGTWTTHTYTLHIHTKCQNNPSVLNYTDIFLVNYLYSIYIILGIMHDMDLIQVSERTYDSSTGAGETTTCAFPGSSRNSESNGWDLEAGMLGRQWNLNSEVEPWSQSQPSKPTTLSSLPLRCPYCAFWYSMYLPIQLCNMYHFNTILEIRPFPQWLLPFLKPMQLMLNSKACSRGHLETIAPTQTLHCYRIWPNGWHEETTDPKKSFVRALCSDGDSAVAYKPSTFDT